MLPRVWRPTRRRRGRSRRDGRPTRRQSIGQQGGITATGQSACSTTSAVAAPNSIVVKPLRPRDPTTIRSASRLAARQHVRGVALDRAHRAPCTVDRVSHRRTARSTTHRASARARSLSRTERPGPRRRLPGVEDDQFGVVASGLVGGPLDDGCGCGGAVDADDDAPQRLSGVAAHDDDGTCAAAGSRREERTSATSASRRRASTRRRSRDPTSPLRRAGRLSTNVDRRPFESCRAANDTMCTEARLAAASAVAHRIVGPEGVDGSTPTTTRCRVGAATVPPPEDRRVHRSHGGAPTPRRVGPCVPTSRGPTAVLRRLQRDVPRRDVPPVGRGSMEKVPPSAPARTRMLSSPLDASARVSAGSRRRRRRRARLRRPPSTLTSTCDGRGPGVAGDVGQRFAQAQQQVAACRFDDGAVDRTLDVARRREPERGGRVVADGEDVAAQAADGRSSLVELEDRRADLADRHVELVDRAA